MRRTQSGIYKYREIALSGSRHAKRRFKAVIITKSALISAVCLISAITFICTALAFLKEVKLPAGETVLKEGMADAVPFLSFKKENTGDEYIRILKFVSGIDFSNPLSIVTYASAMFDDELPQENEDIEKAVFAVDKCVEETVEAAKANGYEVIIIADHGNADNAVNEDDSPNTAHSLNPVPCVYVTENKDAKVSDGILADVAPSILSIMGLEQPKEMTGKNLLG